MEPLVLVSTWRHGYSGHTFFFLDKLIQMIGKTANLKSRILL
jgi:hypothetical protein